MSERYRTALAIGVRSAEDMLLAGLIGQFIDFVFPEVPKSITTGTQLFYQTLILAAEGITTALLAYESKDFFYGGGTDPTEGLLFTFFVVFQPKLTIRFRMVVGALYSYLLNMTFLANLNESANVSAADSS